MTIMITTMMDIRISHNYSTRERRGERERERERERKRERDRYRDRQRETETKTDTEREERDRDEDSQRETERRERATDRDRYRDRNRERERERKRYYKIIQCTPQLFTMHEHSATLCLYINATVICIFSSSKPSGKKFVRKIIFAQIELNIKFFTILMYYSVQEVQPYFLIYTLYNYIRENNFGAFSGDKNIFTMKIKRITVIYVYTYHAKPGPMINRS